MYKLLIVDDEPLVQAGIRSMLDWSKLNITVCDTAANGRIALDIIKEKMPDIVITDIKMPVMNGLDLAKACRDEYADNSPVFIILTSYEDFGLARNALTLQVSDYLVKLELTPETLSQAVCKAVKQIDKRNESSTKKADIRPFYDKFLISLLNDLFESKEQFELQRKDLNINLNYDEFICCYGEIENLSEAGGASRSLSLYSSSLELLKELSSKYFEVHALSLDIRHFALIVCLNDAADDSGIRLKEVMETINSSLKSYYNSAVTLGIGMLVHSTKEISDSYQSARQAFHHTDGDAKITCFDEGVSASEIKNFFNMSLFKADLTRAFEEYDSELLKETVGKITGLFKDHPYHYVQALDAASNILYLSISLLQNGESVISGLFKDYSDGYRSLYRQTNVPLVLDWLDSFVKKLSDYFSERKKDYKNHIVTNVKKYINANVDKRLSLNEVAAVFGISPSYLSQLFGKYNDCGFSEHINLCKVNKAKELLDEGNLKVYEIADTLGFESAFYFSKVFKKIEGIAPTEYLNK